jgi:hypothetical protein
MFHMRYLPFEFGFQRLATASILELLSRLAKPASPFPLADYMIE